MTWDVPEFGEFEYTNDAITLSLADGEWLIDWSSRAIHPALREDGQRLGTVEDFRDRAPILDRDGEELVSLGSVVDVGVEVCRGGRRGRHGRCDRGGDRGRSRDAHEGDRERGGGRGRARRSPCARRTSPRSRRSSARCRASSSRAGRRRSPPPATSRGRCSAPSGPATAEQVEESDGELDADDIVGQSGLSAAYDEQLAGKPERSVVIRNADGEAVETLETRRGRTGRAARDDALGRGADGRRGRVRRRRGRRRAGRARAPHRRHPGGREPADRGRAEHRLHRPVPARLDLQGGHDRRPARHGARHDGDRRLPGVDRGRRPRVRELRRLRGRARCRSRPTSPSRATRRSYRSRTSSSRRRFATPASCSASASTPSWSSTPSAATSRRARTRPKRPPR